MRLAPELQLQPGISTVVAYNVKLAASKEAWVCKLTWAKHQSVYFRHGGNLFDVLDALDAFDLRNDADVLVRAFHVEGVLRV